MSQDPPLLSPVGCPKCGAANYAHAQKCWICHSALPGQTPETNPYEAPAGKQPQSVLVTTSVAGTAAAQDRVETVFLCLLVAIVVLAALVGIGLGAQDSGLLTLYLIVVVPSLGAAGVRALYSLAKGENPKPSKMIMTFVFSALVTFGIGALLIVCSVIFLFLMCAQMLSGMGPR